MTSKFEYNRCVLADLGSKKPTVQEKNEEKEMVKLIEKAKSDSKRNCKGSLKSLLDIASNTTKKLKKTNRKLNFDISNIDPELNKTILKQTKLNPTNQTNTKTNNNKKNMKTRLKLGPRLIQQSLTFQWPKTKV